MKVPDHWRPWTKKVPAWLLFPLVVLLTPAIILLSSWDGGIKEGASYVAELWRDLVGANRSDAIAARGTRGEPGGEDGK